MPKPDFIFQRKQVINEIFVAAARLLHQELRDRGFKYREGSIIFTHPFKDRRGAYAEYSEGLQVPATYRAIWVTYECKDEPDGSLSWKPKPFIELGEKREG